MIDWSMDESGSSNDKTLVVSAVIGQTVLVRKFERDWTRALKDAGVDYFHAKEHWNLRAKAYHGISFRKREALLCLLATHMQKYCRATVSAQICLDEFEAAVSSRFKNTFGCAYAFGVHLLLVMTRFYLADTGGLREPINILIENGHANAGGAIGQISTWKNRADVTLNINTQALGDKASRPILQAADLSAYAFWKYTAGEFNDPTFSALRHRAGKLKAMHLPWNRSLIQAVRNGVDTHQALRKQGLTDKSLRDLALW
jgi:hypothetical protein